MAAQLNIVVIEDHDALRHSTVSMLRDQGFRCSGLSCSEELGEYKDQCPVDVYVLDLNLPGEDGLTLAKRIRHSQPQVGIVIVTGQTDLITKLSGYENGADIYLQKPIPPDELSAAIKALSRRLQPTAFVRMDGITLNLASRVLNGPANKATLSESEVLLISSWIRTSMQQLELWQIAELIGNADGDIHKSTLEVRIVRLRKKLQDVSGCENTIRVIRGMGYQLLIPIVLV